MLSFLKQRFEFLCFPQFWRSLESKKVTVCVRFFDDHSSFVNIGESGNLVGTVPWHLLGALADGGSLRASQTYKQTKMNEQISTKFFSVQNFSGQLKCTIM